MNIGFFTSPTYKLFEDNNGNSIYIKRDDLIPFSFGGNKVRIALEYIQDMEKQGANCIIGYGGPQSNLVRVLANMCDANKIKCFIITPDSKNQRISFNAKLTDMNIARNCIITCQKNDVALTVEQAISNSIKMGYSPYYINGNAYGQGNEKTPVKAYIKAFKEILNYEQDNNLRFEYIFHASGTGMTQSGLILGSLKSNSYRNIIGISIARDKKKGMDTIRSYLETNAKPNNIKIDFVDDYVCGGYGEYNKDIEDMILSIYKKYGIPLDPIYTGKAFWGMQEYIKKFSIKNQNILFIHTGGTPLFFDFLRGDICQ